MTHTFIMDPDLPNQPMCKYCKYRPTTAIGELASEECLFMLLRWQQIVNRLAEEMTEVG